jgi:hypothetical protein
VSHLSAVADEPAAVAGDDLVDPTPTGCLSIELDEAGACVVRVRGTLAREGISRVEVVLEAVEPMDRPVVVDLARARTLSPRLLRVIAAVAARRGAADRAVVLRGVHPDVVPDLESASLPETFLVYAAVCR